MIVKSGSGYVVKDHTGKKILGHHSTKASAVKQLQAIEINKRKKGRK